MINQSINLIKLNFTGNYDPKPEKLAEIGQAVKANGYYYSSNINKAKLQGELQPVKATLEKLGLNKEQLQLFDSFVNITAPVLVNMGFPDAIPHSAQVARKCAIEAKAIMEENKEPINTTEILKAAIVGWIHDPKLPDVWENLATHPIVAGAIAKDVLTKIYNGRDKDSFIKGVTEALFINNDSDWVKDNVIKPKLRPGPQFYLDKRFKAMPEREIPKIPANMRKRIDKIPYETGINNITVPASTMFCHHLEVSKDGKIAAEALFRSDPMLLSPHKIMLNDSHPDLTGRISSFIKSFNKNINMYPQEFRKKQAEPWQKELYISMLQAADEFTGSKNVSEYKKLNIKQLEEKLCAPETWGIYGKNPEKIGDAANVVKKHYDIAAETSLHMFKV